MPTYSYSCKDCGAQHDIVQSMSDPTLTECPACGGHMRKLFNNVGVVFKGSGFYRTDSRDSSSSSTKPAEKKADATTPSTSSASTASSGTSTSSTSGSSSSTSSSSSSSTAAKSA